MPAHMNDRQQSAQAVISEATTVVVLAVSGEGDLMAAIATAIGALPAAEAIQGEKHLRGFWLGNNGATTCWLRNASGGASTGMPIPAGAWTPFMSYYAKPGPNRLMYEAAANTLYALLAY